MKTMDHSEAVQEMATERYVLDELTPELKEAFEEHVFDCPECALDLKAAVQFVKEAKAQLPELTMDAAKDSAAAAKSRDWFAWLRPLFANPMIAGPVFACLLAIVAYQNLVTVPQLRSDANEPRVVPLVSLHGTTRGAGGVAIEASHKQGFGVVVDLPQEPAYPSYAFELYDAQGKTVRSLSSSGSGAAGETLSLVVPGGGLSSGSYTLKVFGVDAAGQRVEVERNQLDLHFKD